MALTDAQKIRVFECLEITYGPGSASNANVDKATIHNNYGIQISLTEMDSLRDELLVYLGDLDSNIETEIIALLVDWDDVRMSTVVLQDGSTAETSGVTNDPAAKRARIRTLMQVYVPVMDLAQSAKRRQGPDQQKQLIFAR